MVPPANTSSQEGTRVKLTCQAEGHPNNITYRWYHNGVDVTLFQTRRNSVMGSIGLAGDGGSGARAAIYADGSLVIGSVSPDDSGWYTCRPTNGLGIPPEATAFLDVTCECSENLKDYSDIQARNQNFFLRGPQTIKLVIWG